MVGACYEKLLPPPAAVPDRIAQHKPTVTIPVTATRSRSCRTAPAQASLHMFWTPGHRLFIRESGGLVFFRVGLSPNNLLPRRSCAVQCAVEMDCPGCGGAFPSCGRDWFTVPSAALIGLYAFVGASTSFTPPARAPP